MRLPDIFSHAFTKYVLALALAMIAFCASLPVSGPAHFPDETAYLANASAIAGFHNDLASSYHAGYSIIIAPAFYFGKTPETIWLYVKLINALLYFVTILSLFSLAKILFPETKCTSRMIAVLITAFYPIYFIMPGYSFSESAFLCFFILTFLCFERVRNDSSLNTVLFALLTGYLYWIHPKGIVVGIAAIMALAYIALRTRRVTPLLIFLPLYSMTLIIYKLIFVPWLYSRMTISGAAPIQHYPSVIDVVLNLLTLPKLAEFMGRFSGQAFYLIIGSVGLVMIGLMSFWIKSKAEVFSRGHLKIISSYHATFIFLTLCLIGMMTMTALSFTYFSYTTRLDQWMYGRYTESVIAPLILAGVISVMGRGGRAVSISKGLTIILSVCFFASILWLVIQPYDPTSRPNISAFWQDFFVRDYGVLIWAICGLIPIIFLIFIRPKWGLILILFIFLFCCLIQTISHVNTANSKLPGWSAAQYIREHYPRQTVVGFDNSYADSYTRRSFWSIYGFILYDYPFRRMTVDQWKDEPSTLLFTYDTKFIDGKVIIFHSPDESPFLLSH